MWKAICLLSCFAVTLGCGTLYAYSAYAPQLSERLGLSASTISTIGMLGNFSMSFSGPFAGWIVDTHGFLIPIVTSVLCTFCGYSMILTLYEKSVSSVPLLSLALFLVGIGSTCAFSASVKCAALNFPQIRGTATAITMSGYGLSAFLMSITSRLTSNSVGSNTGGGASHMLSVLTVFPSLLMVLFGPIVIKSQHRSHAHTRQTSQMRSSQEEYPLDNLSSDLLVERITERTRTEREVYGLSLLKTKTFWLYFLMLGILAGMGQAYIYTCGYMVKALLTAELSGGTPSKEVTSIGQNVLAPLQAQQVAIISVANCVGRLLSGTFSDTVKNKLKFPRVASLLLALSLGLSAMIAAYRVEKFSNMWVPSILIGLFYGAIFGAFPGIVSDSFGLKRLSSNWGLVALAPIPFSSWLAIRIGKFFDANSSSSGTCVGSSCFKGAYPLHIGLAGSAFVLLFIVCRSEWSQK